jgi:hypothetical protein
MFALTLDQYVDTSWWARDAITDVYSGEPYYCPHLDDRPDPFTAAELQALLHKARIAALALWAFGEEQRERITGTWATNHILATDAIFEEIRALEEQLCTGYNDCPHCGQDPYSPASEVLL